MEQMNFISITKYILRLAYTKRCLWHTTTAARTSMDGRKRRNSWHSEIWKPIKMCWLWNECSCALECCNRIKLLFSFVVGWCECCYRRCFDVYWQTTELCVCSISKVWKMSKGRQSSQTVFLHADYKTVIFMCQVNMSTLAMPCHLLFTHSLYHFHRESEKKRKSRMSANHK